MKILVSIIYCLSCLALTWGYLPSQTLSKNIFKASIGKSTSLAMARQDSQGNTNENTDRRRFVVQAATAASTVFGGLLIASPDSTFAAAPPQTTQTKADLAGTPPRNKRVGGLVTKIRNIGKVMVRTFSCILYGRVAGGAVASISMVSHARALLFSHCLHRMNCNAT
jgi:hypothetical protein